MRTVFLLQRFQYEPRIFATKEMAMKEAETMFKFPEYNRISDYTDTIKQGGVMVGYISEYPVEGA